MRSHLLSICGRERGATNPLLIWSCHGHLNVDEISSIDVNVFVDPQVFDLSPVNWLASVTHRNFEDHILSELLAQGLNCLRQSRGALMMWIKDHDILLDKMSPFLVHLGAVLRRHILFHTRDCSQGVRLIRQHEIYESYRLVQQLMVAVPSFVQEPFLPPMIPRSKSAQFYLSPHLCGQIPLSFLD